MPFSSSHGLGGISSHNNYYVWGPRGHDGSVMIGIGGDLNQMRGLF